MKTPEEISTLQSAVTAFRDHLGPYDDYGYPTDEERSEADAILGGLEHYLLNGISDDEAVQSWLEGEDEYRLADYL